MRDQDKRSSENSRTHSELLDSSDGGEKYKSLVSAELLKEAPQGIAAVINGQLERDATTGRLLLRDRTGERALSVEDQALRSTYGASTESVEIIDNRYVLITYSCSGTANSLFKLWKVLVDGLNAEIVYVRPLI